MKKIDLLLVLLLIFQICSSDLMAQENRSKWSLNSGEDIQSAKEMKAKSGGWSLDLQWEVDITEVCALPSGWGPVQPRGVATDGNEIFLSAENMSEYYKYDFDGNYLGSFTGVPGVGAIVDLNYYDGQFFGGWYSDIIHKYDIENNVLIEDIVATVSNGVMAYDGENDIIYSAGIRNTGYDNPINVLSGDGELLYSFARQNNHIYSGLAYDDRVPCLWGLAKNTANKNTLVQISLPSGEETGVVFEIPDYLNTNTIGKPAGGLSLTYLESTGHYMLTGMVTERFVWGMHLIMNDPVETDAAIVSMVSPLSAMGLLGDHTIEFRLKNAGNTTISSVPVSCSVDGETPAVFTIDETIPAGEFLDVSLPLSVQFADYNDSHEIELTVNYPGDENVENDAIVYTAESIEPYYYEPNSYCDYGDGILSFQLDDISNLNTGCTNNGYENYTAMSTNVVIGNTYTAKLATDGPTQSGFMWIDFNNDMVFDNDLELVTEQFWIPDGGLHPVEFTIPEGVQPGTYRMRALVEWVLEEFPYFPNAQMDMGYGEMEDYTLIITAESIELDAGVYNVDMPNVIRPSEMIPTITVKNFGDLECSFEVIATADGYSSSVMVDNLASKDTKVVEFDPYTAVNGDFNLEFCTNLDGDELDINDCADFDFRVCDQDRENVLVEIGTGTWCGFCPGAAMGADELVSNGKNVSIIEYHAGDSYAINAGLDRLSYYGVTAFPTAVFDGVLKHEGGSTTVSIYDDFLPLYEAAIDLPSAYNIDVNLYENAELDYNLQVTIDNPIGFDDENLKLYAVLTESHIQENWQILDELNFAARSVYPNSDGDDIDFSSGDSYTNTFNIVVSGNYDLDNCKISVFVQDIETGFVWQSTEFGFDIVGVEALEANSGIELFPNPSNGLVHVKSSSDIIDIIVYNSNGSIVYQENEARHIEQIDLNNLEYGFYTFRIRTKDGVFAHKFILNKN